MAKPIKRVSRDELDFSHFQHVPSSKTKYDINGNFDQSRKKRNYRQNREDQFRNNNGRAHENLTRNSGFTRLLLERQYGFDCPLFLTDWDDPDLAAKLEKELIDGPPNEHGAKPSETKTENSKMMNSFGKSTDDEAGLYAPSENSLPVKSKNSRFLSAKPDDFENDVTLSNKNKLPTIPENETNLAGIIANLEGKEKSPEPVSKHELCEFDPKAVSKSHPMFRFFNIGQLVVIDQLIHPATQIAFLHGEKDAVSEVLIGNIWWLMRNRLKNSCVLVFCSPKEVEFVKWTKNVCSYDGYEAFPCELFSDDYASFEASSLDRQPRIIFADFKLWKKHQENLKSKDLLTKITHVVVTEIREVPYAGLLEVLKPLENLTQLFLGMDAENKMTRPEDSVAAHILKENVDQPKNIPVRQLVTIVKLEDIFRGYEMCWP